MMRTYHPALCLTLLALHAQSALAREAAPGTPLTPPATENPGRALKPPVLAQATPPQAAPQKPGAATLPSQKTETINYENWVLTCREFLEGPKKRSCSMTVAVQKQDTNQIVLALTVQPNEQGQMVASIQTPTGIAIAPGVELKLEKAAARKLAFDFCEPSRCSASLIADKNFAREASAAASLTVIVQSSDGKPVNFEFPIKGFDKAYAKMTGG
jgi:invasion protein IalB